MEAGSIRELAGPLLLYFMFQSMSVRDMTRKSTMKFSIPVIYEPIYAKGPYGHFILANYVCEKIQFEGCFFFFWFFFFSVLASVGMVTNC